MDTMTKEESYADRRQLFKGIWETAMQFDEKDADNIMAKPKVIKTLRLDEVDKYVIGKRKKERIRNLRTVCKKILEFCNRQDVEDMFYEKRGVKGIETDDIEQPNLKFDVNVKKVKTYRRKMKTKRARSLFAPKKLGYQTATSEKSENYPTILTNSSRNNSPNKNKRTTFISQRASVTHRKLSKVKSNPDAQVNDSPTKGIIASTRRKIMRKKRTKRKKSTTPNLNPPGPSGAPHPVRYLTQSKGRIIVKTVKQFLIDNKIEVTYSTNKVLKSS